MCCSRFLSYFIWLQSMCYELWLWVRWILFPTRLICWTMQEIPSNWKLLSKSFSFSISRPNNSIQLEMVLLFLIFEKSNSILKNILVLNSTQILLANNLLTKQELVLQEHVNIVHIEEHQEVKHKMKKKKSFWLKCLKLFLLGLSNCNPQSGTQVERICVYPGILVNTHAASWSPGKYFLLIFIFSLFKNLWFNL